jgi:hypothetical protein
MRTPSKSLALATALVAFGWLTALSALDAAAGPPVKKPVAAPVKSDKVDLKTVQCPPDGGVVVVKRDIKLICKDEFHDCESDISLVAKNCTKEFLSFVKLEIYEHGRRNLVLEFSPPSLVKPGDAWQEKIPWTTPGDLEAVVYFGPPGGGSTDSARGEVKVHNHGLEQARAACDACHGIWGKSGPNPRERCSCKTADANKRCTDGDDCKGQCMFDGYDGKGREIGHCSDSEHVSGCVKIVAKGQSQLEPRLPPPRKLDTCLD